ncbi:hypothetical protein FQ186_27190 [Pseudomonas sp. ANT_H14]|uniref:hypothetical protein n=1 Tax=Pseudomonas sp. ANT_H14 TaxID=2597349 RepID=UPI0011EF3066|nr:hypothetical protein [Pseudomonas sp. ANT_H14]KAA0946428.1 hypothetical protein FQ186_27190 [Pseudomonas sp. ANT_H14]
MDTYMSYGFSKNLGATEIGLTSLGCLSVDGTPRCPRYQNDCNIASTTTCMITAMSDFPETKAEILLAGILIASTHASSIFEMHGALSSFENAIQATCI